jgi:orotidine-5'-phosphate decarboxylase
VIRSALACDEAIGTLPMAHMNDTRDSASRLVFALDLPTVDQARAMAHAVRDAVGMFKVGLELFVEAGPRAVSAVSEAGRPVFLDLKLHDIPETVDRAVGRASALGASMLTVHASGGPAMLRRAAERAAREGAGLQIVAVTVLTSFDWGDLAAIGMEGGIAGSVERLARMAWTEGVRAFVCSPHEAATVRAALGPEATIITPGVRPRASSGGDDQKRTLTAHDAIVAGASWVVVGRPIRDAADPLAAARAIALEVEQARASPGEHA